MKKQTLRFLIIFFIMTSGAAFASLEKKVSMKEVLVQDGIYVVTVEVESQAELHFAGVSRFLLTNSDVAKVTSQTPTALTLQAQKIGNTFIHVWEPAGRKTVKLIVTRKKLPESTVAKREQDRLEKKETFKIGYQFEFVSTNIGPEFSDTKNDFMRLDHRFTVTGESPFAYISGFARWQDQGKQEFRKAYTDGTLRITNVSSATRIGPYPVSGPYMLDIGPHAPVGPFHDFALILGDNYHHVTPFTAPWSLSRGVFWYHTIWDEKIDYLMLWTQDQELIEFRGVGAELINPPDHYYSGGDVTWHVNEALDLGGTFFFSYGDRTDEQTISDHVAAGNYFLDFEWITFDAEIAQTEDAVAWRQGADLYLGENYHLGGIYRDIPEDFFAINGQTEDRGERGILARAEADPFDFLNLSLDFDRFKDRLFPNEGDPDGFNTDFMARSRIDLPWRMYVTSYFRNADRTASLISREESAYSFQLNKTFSRPRGLGIFARYEKRDVENHRSELLSYDRDSVKLGARWQVLRGLSLGITQEWAFVDATDDITLTVPPPDFLARGQVFVPVDSYLIDERTSPRRLTADIDYYSRILDTPFYLNVRLRLEEEEDTESVNSFFAGEDTYQGEAELAYIPSDYFKAYCRGRLEQRRSEIRGEKDLVEAELVVGANVLFDTGLRWEPQGGIRGKVFKDLNGNGVVDKGEPGVPNITLNLNDKKKAQTDAQGEYNFSAVRGKLFSVTLDLDTVPAGFINTTAFSQDASIRQGKVTYVNFGIIARAGIRGVVFNDVNGNGFLDGEDKGIAKVTLQLEDAAMVQTDAEGRYYFENVSPAEHELTLVLESLPLNYVPKAPVKEKIQVTEGRTRTHYFPVQATRVISGKVFEDKNGNAVLDPGEKGMDKVMVSIGPNLVLTNENGDYQFKNLPAGKQVVELNAKGIPAGYQLSTPASCVVDLGAETVEKSGVNFGLKK